ncbi:amino-acid N-acetyltransferase [Anaerolineae bacterium]|nr:amino-acid N-acetyltransferase [Anaerolineae bacterium]
MIEIKRIEPHQVGEIKHMILTVARGIYEWQESLDEIVRAFDARGEFSDIDHFQSHYLDRRGQFLVALDAGRVVGSGAVRQIDATVCELKRIWLLEAYQGKRLGYRLAQMLFDFARGADYEIVRLETDKRQTRAIAFYRQLGFQFIEPLEGDPDDVWMEMSLSQNGSAA